MGRWTVTLTKLAARREAAITGKKAFADRQRGKARDILRSKHADLSDDAINGLLDGVPDEKRLALDGLISGAKWANEAERLVP